MESNVKRFIADTKAIAKKNGIKIKLKRSVYIYTEEDPNPFSGYFDEDAKELVVAIKRDDWLELFLHESCHMDQYVQDEFLWGKLSHGYNLFFEWLNERRIFKKEVIEESVQDLIRLEKDCELRVLKKIEKYNLPIDTKQYCQKANAYLYAYLFAVETKKWVVVPYEREEIWGQLSGRICKSYIKIPRRLRAKFAELSKE